MLQRRGARADVPPRQMARRVAAGDRELKAPNNVLPFRQPSRTDNRVIDLELGLTNVRRRLSAINDMAEELEHDGSLRAEHMRLTEEEARLSGLLSGGAPAKDRRDAQNI